MLLSALCCNCRVHCDLRHGPCKLLCLGGLQNPHRANLTLVGVVLSDELSFHFYFPIFVALMAGIGKLRAVSWIIKQRMNKKNIQGWLYLFCYLKNICQWDDFSGGSVWVQRSGKQCLLPWHISVALLNAFCHTLLSCDAEKKSWISCLTIPVYFSHKPESWRKLACVLMEGLTVFSTQCW